MPKSMQAVIMAGGEGSRLRPLTSNMPKPMLPVANRPLMEHIIELLKSHSITDIVVTVQFLSSVIRNYFGDGSDLGVSLAYATEEVPLGTAGSVVAARDLLSGTFIVISGDALTDVRLEEAVDFHRSHGAAATLVLKRMQDPIEFGIVMTAADGRIERFLEKPTWGQVFSDTINTGIYVLEPEVLDLIAPDEPYDFSSDLFPMMLDKGLPMYGYITEAYWTDVGNAEAYLQANRDALDRAVAMTLPGFERRPQVWVGEDVDVHPTARLEGPVLVGDNSQIGAGAHIGPHAVIGANAVVGDDARISGGVLMERSYVGALARVAGSVLGRSASLEKGASVEEGAVLGDEVVVGAGALIKPRVKVYPSRIVEAGAIVTSSVVKERRASRNLFGARGVSGVVNVGITPLVAVRLGMAYGTMLPRGSVVVTGRDASRAARTMKRALSAGLNSTGVNCHDLELTPMPLTRFTVGTEQAAGGVAVQTSPHDGKTVEIRLFDADGSDISESAQRKIERIFFREDYRRAAPSKLGELEFPPRALEQYMTGLLAGLDHELIRLASLKVVVDYAYGPYSLVGPSVMSRLGCEVLAVNAYTDEHRPFLGSDDVRGLLAKLSDHVTRSGSDLGVLIDPRGETAHLVDDLGRVIDQQQALLAFIRHEVGRGVEAIAVPVSASAACETLAERGRARLIWSTTAPASLMARAASPEVGFAGNTEGMLIFPDFMPAPDAFMTFCKALELRATVRSPLSQLVDELPHPHVVMRDVATPWELKGTVMRRIASASIPGRLLLLDGVKVIEEDRWALIIPYPDEPLCRIWAEAPSPAEAEALAERYAGLVTQAISSEDVVD